jgi:hypothetical protein
MTHPIDPIRWKDNPADAPRGAAEALCTYGAERCGAGERQLLSERLAGLLATTKPASPDLQLRVNPDRVVSIARIISVVSLVAAATLALFVTVNRPHPALPTRRAPSPILREPRPTHELPVREVLAAPSAAPLPTPANRPPAIDGPSAPTIRRRFQNAQRLPPSAAAIARTPERELELLRKAQQAFNRKPNAAQAYLDEHARDYPEGLFVQERDILRIELAMVRGERALARTLAQKFAARFPGSTYQRRLDALLAHDATRYERETGPAVDTQSMDPTSGDLHAPGNSH